MVRVLYQLIVDYNCDFEIKGDIIFVSVYKRNVRKLIVICFTLCNSKTIVTKNNFKTEVHYPSVVPQK